MEDQQFPYYIEDWILWAGNRVDEQGKLIDYYCYQPFSSRLRLANYDVSFIDHGCNNIINGIGFTDRQLMTAVKIITKYRRQIAKQLDISLDYLLESPPHRLNTRKVNRQLVVRKNANRYIVQFPYDKVMVSDMFEYRGKSCGGYSWNEIDRCWSITANELNLSLLCKFIKKHKNRNWQIDPEIQEQFTIVNHIQDNIYNYVPYLDLNENNQLLVYNSNPCLDRALEEFDLNQSIARAVFFADNYGLQIGSRLTKCVKEQYNSIYQVLLASQSEIFQKGINLQTDLSISDLEYFMKNIQADHWIVVTFGMDLPGENALVDALLQTNVPGKQSHYQYRDKKKKIVYESLVSELKSESVVLFVDNTHVLSQLLSELPNRKSLLKVVYLYSHDTGKKIENM
jgi:hypothetical protein